MPYEASSVDRREFLVASGASALSVVTAQPASADRAAADGSATVGPKEARVALDSLIAGNRRFAEGKTLHAHQSSEWRRHLVGSQKPIATILGCSDSRVPPELVFDQGLGDLFVIRVAGNVVAPDVFGSLAYALEHLRTPLIVVLGHQNCGAVTATVEAMANPNIREVSAIRGLLSLIEPGLKGLNMRLPLENRIAAAVEANVRWSLRQLANHPAGKKLVAEKRCLLTGGVYELSTGLVRLLNG
jgi:carbonic anhydrase